LFGAVGYHLKMWCYQTINQSINQSSINLSIISDCQSISIYATQIAIPISKSKIEQTVQ